MKLNSYYITLVIRKTDKVKIDYALFPVEEIEEFKFKSKVSEEIYEFPGKHFKFKKDKDFASYSAIIFTELEDFNDVEKKYLKSIADTFKFKLGVNFEFRKALTERVNRILNT